MIELRIQRKRTKGFNLQEYSKSLNGLECIVVSRPSKWGNPFRLQGDMVYVWAGHRRKILSPWVCYYDNGNHTIEEVVKLFRDLLMDLNSHDVEPEIRERFRWMRNNIQILKNKNIACFCKEGCACHGDPLIELANTN